jgi:hypothetical protein
VLAAALPLLFALESRKLTAAKVAILIVHDQQFNHSSTVESTSSSEICGRHSIDTLVVAAIALAAPAALTTAVANY